MSRHTPGPWSVGTDRIVANCVLGPDRHILATVYATTGDDAGTGPKPVSEANVRLMAAAPELLDACHIVLAFLDWLETETAQDDPLRVIRLRVHAPLRGACELAIAKAEAR